MITNLLFQNHISEKRYRWQSGSSITGKKLASEIDLVRDLKLDILFDAMADGNSYLKKLCRNVLLRPLADPAGIHRRQEIVKDALANPEFIRELYREASGSLTQTAEYQDFNQPMYAGMITSMKKVISYSEIASIYLKQLTRIHALIIAKKENLTSAVLREFCQEFLSNYSDQFLREAGQTVEQLLLLRSETEIEIGGHLGTGLKLTDIRLHQICKDSDTGNLKKTSDSFRRNIARSLSFKKADAVILLDNNRLVNLSNEMVEASFLWILRILDAFTSECKQLCEAIREMFGFYTCCINLHQKLINIDTGVTFPIITTACNMIAFHNLTDLGLVLKDGKAAVGNTLSMTGKMLVIITGSNQGGKSTFLRSVGLAQLMAQSGLFVAAEAYECNIYQGIHTHFPNEEDSSLRHGLLEEELRKLSELVPYMKPGSLLLMNESFSTTVEYDAAILAEQVTDAFTKCGITTLFVTHLYEYAHALYLKNSADCCFLRAGRNLDGSRTYQLEEGEPLRSSFSMDLYQQIFG